MITREKIGQYIRFGGDLDKWVRSQKGGMDEILTGSDWTLIDKAVQRLRLEKGMSASREYQAETLRVLNRTFADAEAIQMARDLVKNSP